MGRHSFDEARDSHVDEDASFACVDDEEEAWKLRERTAAVVAGLRHGFAVASDGRVAEQGKSEPWEDEIHHVSEGMMYVTGYSKEEIVGDGLRSWFRKTLVEDVQSLSFEKMWDKLEQGKEVRTKVLSRRKEGTLYWALLQITPLWTQKDVQVQPDEADGHERGRWLLAHMIVWDTPLYRDIMLQMKGSVVGTPQGPESLLVYCDDVSYTRTDELGLPTFVKYAKHVQPLDGEISTRATGASPHATSHTVDKPPSLGGPGLDPKETESILKLIQKQHSFVMSDASLQDCPIAFISEGFTELTGYTLHEVVGKNCRFLQGPLTNPRAVREIREAIAMERECMVRLLNYTKDGKPFWNMFNISPVFGPKSDRATFFVGVQMDVGKIIPGIRIPKVEDPHKALSSQLQHVSSKTKRAVADWGLVFNGKVRKPRPHQQSDPNFELLQRHCTAEGSLTPQCFVSVEKLGSGDVGTVFLVRLRESPSQSSFALKVLDKREMIKRQKASRVLLEHKMLDTVDHPFLPTLYSAFQTTSSLYFLTNYCEGGDLFGLLQRMEGKRLPEDSVKIIVAQVVLAFQHLHLHGCIYRDLKPENILIHKDGYIVVTDFDLSHLSQPCISVVEIPRKGHSRLRRCCSSLTCCFADHSSTIIVAKPIGRTNSFVGTEEYIPPETIRGLPHSSSADWWTLGIFTYEIIYGRSPFLGERREETFSNVLSKPLYFPTHPRVSASIKTFIAQLLRRDPDQRLGNAYGAEDVRASEFFQEVQWERLRDKSAALIPEACRPTREGKDDNVS